MTIEKFKENHIEDAAKLFQENYAEIKGKYPYLPDKFNDSETISSNLQKMISKNPSFVAMNSNQIIGYMTGYSNIKELKGSFSGSYIPEWGHAAQIDGKERIYENLYSSISRTWASHKNYTHIISFLENTKLINTFSMLGFGMQVIDAITDFDKKKTHTISEYKIDRADRRHISQLKEFEMLMKKHLESEPIFLKQKAKTIDDKYIIDSYLSEAKISLTATKNDEIISCIRGVKNEGNISILDTKGTFRINFGYTRSDYRRTGIASILLHEILEIAKNEGSRFCSVDFESQNIQGRSFWLTYFKPIVYSMMRKIDDRIIL